MPKIRHEQIPAIKATIMFALGLPLAAASALTGIGAQVAAQPVIRFLLGLTPERSLGTSIVFGLVAAACGAIGAAMGGLRGDVTIALILAVSATVGALLTVKQALNPGLTNARRIAQTAAMLLGLYILSGAVRSAFGPQTLNSEFFRGPAGYVVMGLVAGILSSVLHLASGVLIVGGLLILSGIDGPHSILISLIVTVLASLIPSLRHATAGGIDRGAGAASATLASWPGGSGRSTTWPCAAATVSCTGWRPLPRRGSWWPSAIPIARTAASPPGTAGVRRTRCCRRADAPPAHRRRLARP